MGLKASVLEKKKTKENGILVVCERLHVTSLHMYLILQTPCSLNFPNFPCSLFLSAQTAETGGTNQPVSES